MGASLPAFFRGRAITQAQRTSDESVLDEGTVVYGRGPPLSAAQVAEGAKGAGAPALGISLK